MELNVLLRGQSNAYYFDQGGGTQEIAAALQYYLGFDGITNKVNIVSTPTSDAAGNITIAGGTSFLPTPSGTPVGSIPQQPPKACSSAMIR